MTNLSWPTILTQLLDRGDLDRDSASWAMRQIMSGEATEAQIGAFMMALRSKGETVNELSGLVDVMLENAVLLDTGDDAVDIVGTGGDLIGTVNISSMASILVASTGVPVLKHGSRSASGKTGSSEMFEVLGIRLDLAPQQIADVFREVGITFFYAPVFHPAMRYVAPVRKQLGVPTTFNFLGPLANPAQPIATALGVSNPVIAPLMAKELASRGRSGLVFRSEDGLDELSTTAVNSLYVVRNGEVEHRLLDAQSLGLPMAKKDQLLGGDPKHNAEVAMKIFENHAFENSRSISDVVKLNAAGGLVAYELAKGSVADIEELFQQKLQLAANALEAGAGLEKLIAWSAATQRH